MIINKYVSEEKKKKTNVLCLNLKTTHLVSKLKQLKLCGRRKKYI